MVRPCRTVLAALLVALTLAGTALAGTFEDATAACNRGDCVTAVRLFRPLAGAGDLGARYSPGVVHDKGRGVPQDDAETGKRYRKAADQGIAVAGCRR